MMCEVLREIRGRGLPGVARAVERALDSDRLDLASLGIRKHLPVSGPAVPEQLASPGNLSRQCVSIKCGLRARALRRGRIPYRQGG